MTEIRSFRNGHVAVYRGKEYACDAGFGGTVTLVGETDREAVPITDLSAWYFVATRGTFLGESFTLGAEYDDGTVAVTLAGGNGRKIAEEWSKRRAEGAPGSYWQEDRLTFCATVPKDEITDIHEERRDVLAEWRERNKGQG